MEQSPSPATAASSLPIWRAVAITAGIFSVLLLAMFFHYNHAEPKTASIHQSTIEKRFWRGLFTGLGRTLVVTGDSSLVLYKTFGRQDVSLSDYIVGNFHPQAGGPISPELEHDLSVRRYTSVADPLRRRADSGSTPIFPALPSRKSLKRIDLQFLWSRHGRL